MPTTFLRAGHWWLIRVFPNARNSSFSSLTRKWLPKTLSSGGSHLGLDMVRPISIIVRALTKFRGRRDTPVPWLAQEHRCRAGFCSRGLSQEYPAQTSRWRCRGAQCRGFGCSLHCLTLLVDQEIESTWLVCCAAVCRPNLYSGSRAARRRESENAFRCLGAEGDDIRLQRHAW